MGRPPVRAVIKELAVRMAKDNSTWGYTRIQGALSNPGYSVGRTSIACILKEYGVEPLRRTDEPTSWSLGVGLGRRVSHVHSTDEIVCMPRLVGMLNHYRRAA